MQQEKRTVVEAKWRNLFAQRRVSPIRRSLYTMTPRRQTGQRWTRIANHSSHRTEIFLTLMNRQSNEHHFKYRRTLGTNPFGNQCASTAEFRAASAARLRSSDFSRIDSITGSYVRCVSTVRACSVHQSIVAQRNLMCREKTRVLTQRSTKTSK